MSNTVLNRSVVAILTNKTGGVVAQGDVVVLSRTYQSSFETVATDGYVDTLIGVVVDPGGIGVNLSGGVVLSGYAPKINLNSPGGGPGQFVKTSGLKLGAATYSMGNGSFASILSSGTSPSAFIFAPITGM